MISSSEDEGKRKRDIFGDYEASGSDSESDDYHLWETLRSEAVEHMQKELDAKIEKSMVKHIVDRKQATRTVAKKLLPVIRKAIYRLYHDRVREMEGLRKDPVHKSIMKTKRKMMEEDDYEEDESLKHAIKRRKYLIQKATGLRDEDVLGEHSDDADNEESDDK